MWHSHSRLCSKKQVYKGNRFNSYIQWPVRDQTEFQKPWVLFSGFPDAYEPIKVLSVLAFGYHHYGAGVRNILIKVYKYPYKYPYKRFPQAEQITSEYLKIHRSRGSWLAQSAEHATRIQGCEFQLHVGGRV